jgi:uncharacterized protein
MCLKRILILALLMFLPLPAWSLDVPQLTGRVNDYAGMLSPETKTVLEQKLAGFERDQSTQVVVLTIPSLQGDILEQFAIRVAEQWKPGQKGKDNGVLLILAKDERKVRIEVGMGLQGVLPDITASHIIRDVMRPYLKDNNYDQGISAGVDAIMAATKGEFKASPQDAARKSHRTSPSAITLFLLAAVAALILGTFSRYLGGAAGAAGLPLAAWFSFPGITLLTLVLLATAGFAGGMFLSMLLGGMFGGGGGGPFGGGWGGGFFGGFFGGGFGGGGSSGGSSGGDDGGFSGGGGDFDGGGSSDDY